MNQNDYYYIMSFASTTDALYADKAAREHSMNAALMPVPRELCHGCGLALRFLDKQKESILTFCEDASVHGSLVQFFTDRVDGKHPYNKIHTY